MAALSFYRLVYFCGVGTVIYIYGLLVQPIYLLGPTSIFLAFIYSIGDRIKYDERVISSLTIISLLTVVLVTIQIVIKANIGVLWNFALCLFIYLSITLISAKLNYKQCVNIIIRITWIIAIYALIDGVWRLLHPNPEQIFEGNPFFYRFKDNSLMFEDSNFVGATLVVAYGAIRYLATELNIRQKKLGLLIFISTVLTFSRASIIALVAVEFFCLFWRFNKILKILIIIFFITILMYSFNFLFEDGSFRTKFYIIDLFLNAYPKLSLENKLFGVGLGNSFEFLGIGAHSVIVVYGFELGLVGTLIQLLIVIFMVIASRGRALFVLFPYYINGFSLTAIAIPSLFFFIGIITIITSKVRNGNNKRFNSNL